MYAGRAPVSELHLPAIRSHDAAQLPGRNHAVSVIIILVCVAGLTGIAVKLVPIPVRHRYRYRRVVAEVRIHLYPEQGRTDAGAVYGHVTCRPKDERAAVPHEIEVIQVRLGVVCRWRGCAAGREEPVAELVADAPVVGRIQSGLADVHRRLVDAEIALCVYGAASSVYVVAFVVGQASHLPCDDAAQVQGPVRAEDAGHHVGNVSGGGIVKTYGELEVRVLVGVERYRQTESPGIEGRMYLTVLHEFPRVRRWPLGFVARAHLGPRWLRQRKCQRCNN